jgi:hypothetical protein
MHNLLWAIVLQGWQRRTHLASHPVKSGKVTILVKDTAKMDIGMMRYRRRYDLPQLPRGESYYRIGDSFLRVDDETRLVLELIDVLAGIAD